MHAVGHFANFVPCFTGYSPIRAETVTVCILCMCRHSLGVYSAQVPKPAIHARDLALPLSLQQCRHDHTLVGIAAALGLEPCRRGPQPPQLLLQCLFCCCAALQLLPCGVSSPPGTQHSIESHNGGMQSQLYMVQGINTPPCLAGDAEGRQGNVNSSCIILIVCWFCKHPAMHNTFAAASPVVSGQSPAPAQQLHALLLQGPPWQLKGALQDKHHKHTTQIQGTFTRPHQVM